jgi:hypothetical protein
LVAFQLSGQPLGWGEGSISIKAMHRTQKPPLRFGFSTGDGKRYTEGKSIESTVVAVRIEHQEKQGSRQFEHR